MKTHLRLADRQGLLCNRHISPVQMMALMILNHLEVIEREESDVNALKLSMMANGSFDHKKLFPDYFSGHDETKVVEVTDESEIPDDAIIDYSAVEWKSPSDDIEEYHKIMAALAEHSTGQISGEQMSTPVWGDWQ